MEDIDKDLNNMFKSENIKPQSLIKALNTKPKNMYVPINDKYIDFLNHHLNEEYSIANAILLDHKKKPYLKH